MLRRISRVGSLICIALSVAATAPPTVPWPVVAWKSFGQLGSRAYLPAALQFEEREREPGDGVPRALYLDLGATVLSLVSETGAALRLNAQYGREVHSRPRPDPLPQDVRPEDAAAAILLQARNRKFVLLNEEHRTSIQRAFMHRLLPGLRREGFTHLALEALVEDGEALRARGYPKVASGTYLRDPIYGDLVRRAVELGFTIVSYEDVDANARPVKPDEGPVEAMNRRDRTQAENIVARTIARDPEARVIVFAGRSHIAKMGGEGYTPMASALRELAASEPLSVDLTIMMEQGDPALEHRAYLDAYDRHLMGRSPCVFRTPSRKYFTASGSYDMMVFFPRTQFKDGRADWARLNGLRRLVNPGLRLNVERPLLVQATPHGESDDAVPADQVIYRPGKTKPPLLLRPGRYDVRVLDPDGGIRVSRTIRI